MEYFTSMKEIDFNRLIRFGFIGVLNTAFGYSLFSFLIFIGLHYSMAILVGTVIGVIFNFFTTSRIVFKSKDNALIIRFVLVYVVQYTLNVGLFKLLKTFGWNDYITGAILLLPMAIISYILLSTFVYRQK